ncbi:UTP--glucose-1-phosphate uridylyltransferase [Methylonatrum kenyense]|uniref:UTP--glucose-1-phosphate uridylyltransferase n=1 Tax=Methylonatrum kenyense TaxID=455253 RepID=UPI0020BF97D7|nr:UTP--glucose-1-phosphate uridylyltransferase [Methylonatrum kenyense]
MTDHVRTVVFPVAGHGTDFLPATKASPKVMLPVLDKPLIQYAVEEAVASGAENLIFVTGRTSRAVADHFDRAKELEQRLQQAEKQDLLNATRGTTPAHVRCLFVRQPRPLGLGHAVLCARAAIGGEPFAVVLADELIAASNGRPALSQLMDAFSWNHASVIGVQRVPDDRTSLYGIVGVRAGDGRLHNVDAIVEKPDPSRAPSRLGVIGRYVFTPAILDALEGMPPDADGQIQLTDAIARLLTSEGVYAYEYVGERFDCGTRLGYLQATLAYALRRPDLRRETRAYLRQLLASGRLDSPSDGA